METCDTHTHIHTKNRSIPREARNEGPSVARLINLSGRAGPGGAKPREFERKIYLYIYISELIFQKVATEIDVFVTFS